MLPVSALRRCVRRVIVAFGRGAPIPTFPGRRRPGAQVRGWRHGCRGCRWCACLGRGAGGRGRWAAVVGTWLLSIFPTMAAQPRICLCHSVLQDGLSRVAKRPLSWCNKRQARMLLPMVAYACLSVFFLSLRRAITVRSPVVACPIFTHTSVPMGRKTSTLDPSFMKPRCSSI